MKKIVLVGLICVFGAVLLAACGAALPPDDQSQQGPDGSNVWFDNPLDQDVISIPAHVSVVVHGNVPGGISGFEYWLDGNSIGTYPAMGSDYGAAFVQSGFPLLASTSGWHDFKVAVLSMTGQPAAYAQIQVYFDDGGEPVSDAEPTPTPALAYSRCDLFDQLAPRLTLFDIAPGSTVLRLSVDFGTLYGLEQPVEGDEDPWEYSANLGGVQADECQFEGYAGRLFCYFTLKQSQLGTVQPLDVHVNLCDVPVFTHAGVSIIAPLCQAEYKQADCEATGGTWSCVRTICSCQCPSP